MTPPAIRRDATIPEAERDIDIAAYYLRAGKRESAAFYYELVSRRWPGTMYAERAIAVLQELQRGETPVRPAPAPARIGEIIITGNKHAPDNVIRQALNLYPGQILNYADIRAAEQRLRGMKVNAGPPVEVRLTISVLEGAGGGQYKDLLVNVEESSALEARTDLKQLEGVWIITAATMDGAAVKEFRGGEVAFHGERLTLKIAGKASELHLAVSPAGTPKRLRLTSLDKALSGAFAIGSYELNGDDLTLSIPTTFENRDGNRSQPMMTLTLRQRSPAVAPDTTRLTADSTQVWHAPDKAPIRYEDGDKKFGFTANDMRILADGRLMLVKCVLFRHQSGNPGPEQLKAERMVLILDGPIASLEDLRKRNIVSIHMDGPGSIDLR